MIKEEKFPLTAFHNNVIVQRSEDEEKMYGNIVVADTGKEKPLMCLVLATGEGVLAVSGDWIVPIAKVGDYVIVPSFGGTRITYEGEEYLVYKDTDIIAKVNNKN